MSSDTIGAGDGPGAGSEAGSNTDPTGDGRNAPLRWLAVAVVFAVLASSAFLRSASVVDPWVVVAGFVIFLALAFVLAWHRSRSASRSGDGSQRSGDGGGEDDEGGDVWNAIPSWQYEGRHVESGGLTRGEQERALRDIQEQADELSDDPSREP